ncbi:DegT/DnrJ/EryC1/StrS family aminotransferase [Streptomyces sp. NPDC023998]|uniref:aminotransferase class I/II-fold pyridoxal phosphate-dependent enzyme n=1 Tax=Streptomyces sp. NPDC023998 TaxID=3154597 RepID=UPI00340530CA
MDHSEVPVLQALEDFRNRGDVVYGPPGHKQGRGVDPRVLDVLGADLFRADVLMLNGLDDRRLSHCVLERAEELMADAVHAEHAFFSTCGSSLSVKTAMITVAGPGEKLLVSRNTHKSVVAALIISGIHPVWVHPRFDAERHLAHPPEPENVRRALDEHPDAKGMLLITPTDWGTCADIQGVAQVMHERDLPLIVDEAWGAHLPFHDQLPAWGMDADADLVVTSVHKMGAAVEQSSVFHLQGDRIPPTVLKQREDLLGTTSSSSLAYASLDGWRRQMVERGQALLDSAIRRAERIRKEIAALPDLALLDEEVVGPGKAADLDPLRITADVRRLGITGMQAAEWMRTACRVDVGASDTLRVNAQITHADDDATERLLTDAFRRLAVAASTLRPRPTVELPPPRTLELEQAVPPRVAFFADAEQIPASEAVGRIAAEMASPYPPGVPVIAPGEVIGREAIDYLRSGARAGMLVPDAADPTMETIRVMVR